MNINEILTSLPLIIDILLFVIGAVILLKGSDFFVDSAIIFAKKFHVPEIVIGLTLISIGTSLPELASTINSAIKGRSAIAIGNVTGSNITNIALVIGISVVILGNIKVPSNLISRDMIFMLGATVLLLVFSYFFDSTYRINRLESLIMFLLIIAYIFYLFRFNKDDINQEVVELEEEAKIDKLSIAVFIFICGLAGIFLGSEIMIRTIIVISEKMKISDGVVGATIVAFTTSIPELAVTIVGIKKGKSDISLGNVVGSNIFNILGVLGITGMIRSINIVNIYKNTPDIKMLFINLPITLFISILLFVFMIHKKDLNRINGIIFLFMYLLFIYLNYFIMIS